MATKEMIGGLARMRRASVRKGIAPFRRRNVSARNVGPGLRILGDVTLIQPSNPIRHWRRQATVSHRDHRIHILTEDRDQQLLIEA